MNPEKNNNIFNQAKIQQFHPEKGKRSEIKIGTIKVDTPEANPHDIPDVEKYQKVAAYKK